MHKIEMEKIYMNGSKIKLVHFLLLALSRFCLTLSNIWYFLSLKICQSRVRSMETSSIGWLSTLKIVNFLVVNLDFQASSNLQKDLVGQVAKLA